MKIKDTPKVDQPRAKLVKYGLQKLTDAELLAIILRTGTKDLNAVELAKKILREAKNKNSEKNRTEKYNLDSVTVKELMEIKGLGEVKACEIVSVFELARRVVSTESSVQIISAKDVFESVKVIAESKKEHLLAIYLDTRNREIYREIITVGILNASLVHPREVFEPAIKYLSAGIIIVHNHPSGDVEPSSEDIKVTNQLIEAGKIMGIPIVDHVIVSKNDYYSFQENGGV